MSLSSRTTFFLPFLRGIDTVVLFFSILHGGQHKLAWAGAHWSGVLQIRCIFFIRAYVLLFSPRASRSISLKVVVVVVLLLLLVVVVSVVTFCKNLQISVHKVCTLTDGAYSSH